jgi:monofunctional biosynthetic peptidoglycan transglycosylase
MGRKRTPLPRSRKKRIARTVLLLVVAVLAVSAAVLVLTLPDVSGLRTTNPASTSLIRLRQAQAGTNKAAASIRIDWIAFDRIPALFKKCVLVSEDASFYDHRGIDFVELKASIERDIKEGRLARGGSTITQQLAKNLYLSTEKSFIRKIREALIARRLEKHLTKDRIFHLYLNVIEFGPRVFGVQAAARHWFGKDAGELTLEEMVRLAAIIPRPLRTDPRTNDGWMKFKGRWIADTLKTVGAIGPEDHLTLIQAFL